MPLVQISIRKQFGKDEKNQINDIIHHALVEAFKIPEHDFNHRFNEYAEENFHIPEGKSQKYMIIEMTIFPDRSLDTKRLLYELITKELEERLGLIKNEILIVLNEPVRDNWGILGKPSSEIDLGFNTNI